MTSTSTMKTFSLSSCDWIGFDLDHTLVRYRLPELHTLIYESMRQYLVDKHQYNPKLLQIPYAHDFGVKALVYDSLYGNLIQLDSNGLVHTALHGVKTRLTLEEIKRFYPNTLEDIEEDVSKRFLCIFTYFEHCISYLIANIVDLIDNENLFENSSTKNINLNEKYSWFLADFTNGFEYLFSDFNRGNYFSSIRQNPEKFIYQRLDVRQWLEKLKKSNKYLFLATNSRFDYTNLLATYAFGNDWQNLFHLIIVDCKKPSFFLSNTTKRLFHRSIDNDNNIISVTNDDIIKNFDKNYIYSLGNSEDLHLIMSQISNKDPIVIYFGDHIKSDINALKRNTNWLAGVIVEELEYDIPPTIIHTTKHYKSNQLSINNELYTKGNHSKYFSSFFTSPSDSIIFDNDETKFEQTNPDALLPALTSSYWYTYITKHAHLSLSCLSVLANHFDLDHQFEHDQQTKHFVILH
ncbi:unnamed protein product [Adineta steineri]|uniref:Uncharacterized protein n=1 Tax=Adineta steineri TaxID=433720 RepID=A0A814XUK3_9BILA|nr:unnamed protein product [Adineta steineri]CAF3493302.1 unnamed protein product [Adineta steineri]CAF3770242.1 unnamed protein product [Adineta steineri]